MLVFPNAKINLGLEVISKRNDGFHNISSVFYPVGLCDALEIVEGKDSDSFVFSGLEIPGDPGDNLCAKALALLREKKSVPPLQVYLHKAIPMGAGLGGGSSDASFFIATVNKMFALGFSSADLHEFAARLGSDCPFFLTHEPAFAESRGEKLTPVSDVLQGWHLLLINPGLHISTPEAYRHVRVGPSGKNIRDVVEGLPVGEWKRNLFNYFEEYAIQKYPEIGVLKNALYDAGAAYASMTGSGSTVYALFAEAPPESIMGNFGRYFVYRQRL